MAHATAYSAIKSALVARLSTHAQTTLAGVAISYEEPTTAPDVRARGSHESIFLAGAEGSFANVVLCAGELRFDETYTQTVVIQVLLPTSTGSQENADQRAEQLLYEVHAELASQQHWDLADLGLDAFDYLRVTPASQQWVTGFLPTGAGHAARCELGLEVRSRRSFP